MALTNRVLGGFLDKFKQRNCIISCQDDPKNNIKAQTIIISSTSDLTTSITNSVSNYQIENGTNITDHTHPQPQVLSLNVILSNDDFDYTKPQNLFADTAEDVAFTLEEFATQGVKLEIRYKDNVFTDYIITNLSLSKNQEVGDNYSGSITFQKILVAFAQTGMIKKGKQPVQPKAKKKSILAGIFK